MVKPVPVFAAHKGSESDVAYPAETSLVRIPKNIAVLDSSIKVGVRLYLLKLGDNFVINPLGAAGYPLVRAGTVHVPNRGRENGYLQPLDYLFWVGAERDLSSNPCSDSGCFPAIYKMNIHTIVLAAFGVYKHWGSTRAGNGSGDVRPQLLLKRAEGGFASCLVVSCGVLQRRIGSLGCGQGCISGGLRSLGLSKGGTGVIESNQDQSQSAERLKVSGPVLWFFFGFLNIAAAACVVAAFAIFVSFDRWRQGWFWGTLRCIAIPACISVGWHLIWYALSLVGA
jgi:hypothetical protein